jgi:hypothetical protein
VTGSSNKSENDSQNQSDTNSEEVDLDHDDSEVSINVSEKNLPKKRVGMIVTDFYKETIGTIMLGDDPLEVPEMLKVDENEIDPEETDGSDANDKSGSEGDEEETEEKSEKEFDIFMEGVTIMDILLQKSKFVGVNKYILDLNCDSIFMNEIPENLHDFFESNTNKLYQYEDKTYNFIFNSVHDFHDFPAYRLYSLKFVPDTNVLKQIGEMNEQAIMVYGLGMWFIEFYLSRSGVFRHTQYVNEVFATIALSQVDERIMETLDYTKLDFLFPEQKTGEEEGLTVEEQDEIIEGNEPQGYSVTNPLLFNFMNYLLKNNRSQDKDDFLEYLKKTEFKTVTSEVIQELHEVNPTVTETFLRFLFYSRFERLFIDTEKTKFISPLSDYKTRIDGLNESIDKLNKGLETKISELLDMVEEVKQELLVIAKQTARNNYVNIMMDVMRNLILGYHVSAENFKFLDDSLIKLRQEQEKWEEKIGGIDELEGKDFKFLKVEEYLDIHINEPVSRDDSFRLLVV